MHTGQSTAEQIPRRPCGDDLRHDGRWALLRLRWETKKPTLYFRTILLQLNHECRRRFIRVLIDRMDFIACLKVGNVVAKAFPYRDPLGSQIIKDIHGRSRTLSVMPRPKDSTGKRRVEIVAIDVFFVL
jgi:hypothetical protein